MIKRDPENYTEVLLEAARRFDGDESLYADSLKEKFNKKLNSLQNTAVWALIIRGRKYPPAE